MKKFVCILIVMCGYTNAFGEDWPQWRGVNRDGVLDNTPLLEKFPSDELERLWTVPLGAGYSGPTVADGRVYVTDRGPLDVEKEIERVLCFDAADGSLIWEHTYDAPYTISYRAGPRATVTVHQGRAIAVGAMGHMKCLDAETGKVIWEHDLNQMYSLRMPIWGITASPLIYDDLVIQIAAGSGEACVVAFDLETGQPRWQALDERAGYSAPILVQQGQQDVVVCWTGESVSGLNPQTGEVFWNIPMLPRNMPIGVATPIVQGNDLFVSSFYDGSMLIRLDPTQPAAEQRWRRIGESERNTDSLHCMISTPIMKGDFIYGVDSYGELRCLDLKTGDRVWENNTAVPKARWATIHTFRYGDRELLFNDQGELILAELRPDGYREISRTKVLERTRQQLNRRGGVTWAHPAIADGMIYARNDKELVCASLKP
ncbi:PQQ-like beta-propeller repeat protein [Rubripirellula sp.]|jgi:outer membrane protein assembly factor BamB|nr:PQQ-binding-like beta-propeller repeat protein [Planctomycetaceae bacterium]MDA9858334.1 PQQ-like beta-propeller repeat protein [Rubripirellula sp.]MDF1843004.1 PQQ-like beta-propeller repeat protein [Rubripirellula sp.]